MWVVSGPIAGNKIFGKGFNSYKEGELKLI